MPRRCSTSSGVKTASAQISTMSGSLNGIDVQCPSVGYVVITIYDSQDSNISGKLVLAIIQADAGLVGINHDFFIPVAVNRGVYAEVTGPGVNYSYIVRYSL